MTVYYAVIDNQKTQDGDEYALYGTARQVLPYASSFEKGGATIYRIKKKPEFVSQDDMNPLKKADIKGSIEGAKDRVMDALDELELPKTQEEAQDRFNTLKDEWLADGKMTVMMVGATVAAAVQQGVKDPQQLLELAKTVGGPKVEQVKHEATGFFNKLKDKAEGLAQEFRGEAEEKYEQVKKDMEAPAPDGMITSDGQRFVSTTWLVQGNNAERASVQQLARDAQPKKTRTNKRTPK